MMIKIVSSTVLGILIGVLLSMGLLTFNLFPYHPSTSASPPSSSNSFDDLLLTITIDKPLYHMGDVMHVTLKLTNTNPEKLMHITYSTSQKFDLEILSEDGLVVYKWSKGRVFAQVITSITLNPGETIEQSFSITLEGPPKQPQMVPGTYKIVGMTVQFLLDDERVQIKTPEIEFRIKR